ncbi:MAG: transposase [Planctomycetaceae bacterium]
MNAIFHHTGRLWLANAAARFSSGEPFTSSTPAGGRRQSWETMNARSEKQVRRRARRKSEPRIGVLDSQSVKTSDQAGEASDAGKRSGRKRHLLADTLGLVLSCVVHAASVQDS